MPAAPLPPDEDARLAALARYRILDTTPEEAFDDLVRIAARTFDAPISLITLVDRARQWFKARTGLSLEETPRDVAFCAHAILDEDVTVVPDAARDPRFADNPLVLAAPEIRAYAAAPLVTPEGHALGTLCVIDRTRREFSEEDREDLKRLAREAMLQLELRRALLELAASLEKPAASPAARAELERLRATVQRLASERNAALQALERRRRRFRAIVENGFDAVALLDAAGRIVYVSAGVTRHFGYVPAEVAGRPAADYVHPDELAAFDTALKDALGAPGTPFPLSLRGRHRDGRWRDVEGVVTNLLDNPDVRAVVINVRDVSDRRRLEEQVRQTQRMEAVGRLAGGIAHDFNNLLTAILGYAHLLQGDLPEGSPLREFADEIAAAGSRGSDLTRRLLAFSRRRPAWRSWTSTGSSTACAACLPASSAAPFGWT